MGLIAGALGTGSTAIIARATGARHRSLANSICGQSVGLAIVVGAIGGVLVFIFAGSIAGAMGLGGEAESLARMFLRTVSVAIPFMLVLMVANACLRGAGDTVSPALAMVVVDVVNIGCCFALTFGWFGLPQMGFAGIALGATIGYIAGGVMQLTVLLVGRGGVRLFIHRMTPHWHNMRRLLRIGLPNAGESGVMWIVNIILIKIINGMDASAASGAAHAIAVRVEAFSYLGGFAIAIAATTIVGQSLGMKDPRRAEKAAWLAYVLGGSLMTFGGLLFVLFGGAFARLMSADAAVINHVTWCLFYAGFGQAGFAAAIIFGGALRGAGDTLSVMLINMISLIGVRLVGVLVMTQIFHASLSAIWILLSADLFIRGLAMFVRFRHGGWKLVKV
jgi:putative MATE family efflux protein